MVSAPSFQHKRQQISIQPRLVGIGNAVRRAFVDDQRACTVHATRRATIGRTTSTQMNAAGMATW